MHNKHKQIGKSLNNCITSRSIDAAKLEDAGTYSVAIVNRLGELAGTAIVQVEPKEKRPAFVADLQDTQVVEGFPIKLEVKLIGHPPPTVRWLHNGQEIKPQSAKITQNAADGTAALTIDAVSVNDIGDYQVIATNDAGSISSVARLAVVPRIDERQPEQAPKFTGGLRDGNADEGAELVLSAPFVANPVPEIIWSRNDQPLVASDRIRMTCDGRKAGLVIAPAEVTDSGAYSCLLANPLGEDTTRCQVNVRKVFQRPHFTLKLAADQPAIKGLDAKLPVRVTGVPYPEVQWTFNNLPIKSDERYSIKHDGDNNILTIRNCTAADKGTYKCVARNREGEESTAGQLDIVDKM